MFVCQFYALSPRLLCCSPPSLRPCLSPVTVCMRLHLICINALAAHIAELLPTLHKRRRRQRKTVQIMERGGGSSRRGEVLEAGSESSEKCANLVTKLARYFNIFRFAAATATATPTDSITHFSVSPLSLFLFSLSLFSCFVSGTLFKELVQITASWKL